MTTPDNDLSGPDFGQGVALASLADGAMLPGHAHGEPVLLVRRGDELFAVGSHCTHYGGPLADGLLVGDTVRCPRHHACFSLHTGEPQRMPASRCSGPLRPCRTIAPICRRAISPGRRPKTGFRCARPSSTWSTASTRGCPRRSPPSTRRAGS